MAQPSITAATKRENLTVVVQDIRVNSSRWNLSHLIINILHFSRLRLIGSVLMSPLACVAELALIACTPSIHLSRLAQSHTVRIFLSPSARHLNDFHVSQFFDKPWFLFVTFAVVAELIKYSISPRVSLTLLSNCQSMIKSGSCIHYFLFTYCQFFWFVQMFFNFVAVMVWMPTRVKFIIHCNDQRKAVTTCDVPCRNFCLNFCEAITILEISSTTCPLLVMTSSIHLLVWIDHHRMPVACRYYLGLHFDGNQSWNRYVLAWLYAESAVFGVSPAVHLPVTWNSQIKIATRYHIYDVFTLKLFYLCRDSKLFPVEQSPYVHTLRLWLLHSRSVLLLRGKY